MKSIEFLELIFSGGLPIGGDYKFLVLHQEQSFKNAFIDLLNRENKEYKVKLNRENKERKVKEVSKSVGMLVSYEGCGYLIKKIDKIPTGNCLLGAPKAIYEVEMQDGSIYNYAIWVIYD